jgi:uncharacterized protein (TIGR02466 family)
VTGYAAEMATDPFAPIPLFSFPVFSSTIAGYEEHKPALIEEILDLRRKHPGVQRSNRNTNAWHSGSEFLQNPNEHVAWLAHKMLKFTNHCVGRYHDNWATTELQFAACWANVLGPGGWNAPHHHHPCSWSGCFYVSVGDVGKTPGDPSGLIEFINPTPLLSSVGQGGNFVQVPRDGLVFVFPSSLLHFVHPHMSDYLRISIAFNFNVVPKKA